jgi:hypothetical protein
VLLVCIADGRHLDYEDPRQSQKRPDPEKGGFVRIPLGQICPDCTRPTSNFKKLTGPADQGFFPPKIVRICDLGTQNQLGHTQTTSRALDSVEMYIYSMSNATGGPRLIVFPTVTLFREVQGCQCGEFLLTVFEV